MLAFVGVGSGPSLGGTLPPGAVEVGEVCPCERGRSHRSDLSNPVVVRVLAQGPHALAAQMSLVLLGHPAFKSSAPLVSVGNGVRAARIDLTNARYVVTGHTTAQVDLLKDGASDAPAVGYWRFIADLSQPAWLSVEGVALILLALLSLAYIEQFARSLWRGRRRASASVGLAIFVALLAVTVVGIAWLAAGQQPTPAGAIVCAALGAFSGSALAIGLYRGGRLRRPRRRAARRFFGLGVYPLHWPGGPALVIARWTAGTVRRTIGARKAVRHREGLTGAGVEPSAARPLPGAASTPPGPKPAGCWGWW